MLPIPSGQAVLIPNTERTRILLPPGWGDQHWIFLKLKGMLANPTIKPTVYIWDCDERPRSLEFVQRIPFVTAGGYYKAANKSEVNHPVFKATCSTGAYDVVQDWHGFDYLICFNGSLVVGKPLPSIVPNADIDWSYPISTTPAEQAAQEGYRARLGPRYVLFYFSNHGMFTHWVKNCTVLTIRTLIMAVQRQLPGYRLVLTGSSWDAPFSRALHLPGVVNLVGQTNTDQFFGLLKGASCFCGWPGGNGILSTHFGTPTVMIWDKLFRHKGFRTNWVDPGKLGTLYFPAETVGLNPLLLAGMVAQAVRK